MNIREAVEMMFLLGPVMPLLVGAFKERVAERGTKTTTAATAVLSRLMALIQERDPRVALQLVALMYHTPLAVVASYYSGQGAGMLMGAIIEGFSVNSLPELVDTAHALGISLVRWSDG